MPRTPGPGSKPHGAEIFYWVAVGLAAVVTILAAGAGYLFRAPVDPPAKLPSQGPGTKTEPPSPSDEPPKLPASITPGQTYKQGAVAVSAAITVSPTSGPAGMLVTLNGKGFAEGEMVKIDFANASEQRRAQDDGSFSVRFTIPPNASSGTFRAKGLESGRPALSRQFEVRAKQPPE